MTFEVFTICYNEEILLPYFIRHYDKFCDKITVYDNYSTDDSVKICEQNPKVTVIPYDSGNEIRDDIYLRIKNNCWKDSQMDWVIVCDVDEFLYNPFGDDRIKTHSIISPDWWEMISDHLPTTDGQIWEELNYGINLQRRTKCIMFNPRKIREIRYEVGAHNMRPIGVVNVLETSKIQILHYKMLSLEYYINRFALLSSRLSALNRRHRWGYHYDFSERELTQYYQDCWKRKERIPLCV